PKVGDRGSSTKESRPTFPKVGDRGSSTKESRPAFPKVGDRGSTTKEPRLASPKISTTSLKQDQWPVHSSTRRGDLKAKANQATCPFHKSHLLKPIASLTSFSGLGG
ncbi:hypothetical protein V8G54_027444, partial [Vigna mungo]